MGKKFYSCRFVVHYCNFVITSPLSLPGNKLNYVRIICYYLLVLYAFCNYEMKTFLSNTRATCTDYGYLTVILNLLKLTNSKIRYATASCYTLFCRSLKIFCFLKLCIILKISENNNDLNHISMTKNNFWKTSGSESLQKSFVTSQSIFDASKFRFTKSEVI